MKKKILFDKDALKYLSQKVPREARRLFYSLISTLENKGRVNYPYSKKLSGIKNLYELRVRKNGAWRCIYAYLPANEILFLHIFNKKTQKTSKNDIEIAVNRYKFYQNKND